MAVLDEILHYPDLTYYDLKNVIASYEKIDAENIMLLCSPNNPSGNIVSLELFGKMLDKAKEDNVILVVDESFMDFVKDCSKISAKNYHDKYENLMILKGATKFFAISGLIIGYAYTELAEIINRYSKMAVPWCVNSFASVAFMAMAKDKEYLKRVILFIEMILVNDGHQVIAPKYVENELIRQLQWLINRVAYVD